MNNYARTKLMRLLSAVLPYLAWAVSSILTILDWMALRALTVAVAVKVTEAVPMDKQIESGWYVRFTIPAVDRFAVLVFGVISLGLVLAFEYIYRTAHAEGTLKRRFGLITTVQVAVWLLCQGVIFMIGRSV